jgi:Rrf2 family protein
MMSLAKTTGYAIAAMSHLDLPGGQPAGLRQIARKAHVPHAYLAKRMPELVAAGLVRSMRGKYGGVLLARDPGYIAEFALSPGTGKLAVSRLIPAGGTGDPQTP